jgi:hypothetical protein
LFLDFLSSFSCPNPTVSFILVSRSSFILLLGLSHGGSVCLSSPSNLLYTQEKLSGYQRGGYHPACLAGDTFKHRYNVYHKLGFSTAWLANYKKVRPPKNLFYDLSDVQKAQSMGFVGNHHSRQLTGVSRTSQFATIEEPLDKALLQYLVKAAEWFGWMDEDLWIIDLGESFLQGEEPTKLAQPGTLQVPETLFTEPFDHGVQVVW